ncbi:MAG: flagellar hook-basal body complex protein FliE [Pyrinomonadaceae bacterium]
MNINGFGSLGSPAPLADTEGAIAAGQGGGASSASFGSTVLQAIKTLDKSQKTAEHEVVRAVTGQSTDLHQTIIALQSADLSFQLAMQVRNKVIGAYEEIMRMQV